MIFQESKEEHYSFQQPPCGLKNKVHFHVLSLLINKFVTEDNYLLLCLIIFAFRKGEVWFDLNITSYLWLLSELYKLLIEYIRDLVYLWDVSVSFISKFLPSFTLMTLEREREREEKIFMQTILMARGWGLVVALPYLNNFLNSIKDNKIEE